MKSDLFSMVNLEACSDPDFWNKAIAAYDRYKQMRAEIIDASVFVESQLSETLAEFFAGAGNQRATLVRTLILDADFCSFFQKWRLFRDVLEIYAESLQLDQQALKQLRRDLHEVISLRNRFAHGALSVNAADFSVWMEYYEGTKKRTKLDDAELTAAKDLFKRVAGGLNHVQSNLHGRAYVLPETEA